MKFIVSTAAALLLAGQAFAGALVFEAPVEAHHPTLFRRWRNPTKAAPRHCGGHRSPGGGSAVTL